MLILLLNDLNKAIVEFPDQLIPHRQEAARRRACRCSLLPQAPCNTADPVKSAIAS
jgi:hypothetical protein